MATKPARSTDIGASARCGRARTARTVLSRAVLLAVLSGSVAADARGQTPPAEPATPAPPPQATAASPAEADRQVIQVGAVLFYDYTYTKAPHSVDAAGQEISRNAFNVTRTYLNVRGRISRHIQFRITPDIRPETGSGSSLSGSLSFRLKYGYAQFDLSEWTSGWTNTWVRGGIQQTPFIDAEEPVYRYRFQGTLFAERDGGMSSADAGVSFHTDLPNRYGDVHVGLYNGEGYGRFEANDQKAVMLRATVRPLPEADPRLAGLRLTAYVHRDRALRGADRSRFIGAVWLEQPRFNFGAEYLTRADQASPTAATVDSSGYSVFLTPFFQEKGRGLEALLRYDELRPDTRLDGRQRRTIAGLAYWFPHPGGSGTAALLLDYERVAYSGLPTPRPTDERVFVHGLISF